MSSHVTQHCAYVSCLKKNWSRVRAHYWSFVLSLVCSFFFSVSVTTVLHSDDGQMESPLESLLGPLLGQLQESLHGSMGTRGPCLRVLWSGIGVSMENNQDFSDEETFARLTHGSGDESESNCGPYWAPVVSPVIPSNILTTVGGFHVNHHLFLRCSIEEAFINTNLPLPPRPPTGVRIRRRARGMVGCVWVQGECIPQRKLAAMYGINSQPESLSELHHAN